MLFNQFKIKPLLILIAFNVFFFSFARELSYAEMVASKLSDSTREMDIARLNRFLENKIVSEKLAEWGYTKEEIALKINNLSDEELHYFATKAESLEKGGDPVGAVLSFILALLLIALLVILILELTGHDVVIKTKRR